MSNLLNSGMFDFLKEDANARGNSQANPARRSYVQDIRDVLAQAARRTDQVAKIYLSAVTPEQLNEILSLHAHIGFNNPTHGLKTTAMKCTGVSHNGRVWIMHFGTKKFPLHDLDVSEVLGFLQTCENVIYGHVEPVQNTLKG